MMLWRIAAVGLVLQAAACQPGGAAPDYPSPYPRPPDPTGRPPAPGAVPAADEEEREIVSTMTVWLERFRDLQTQQRRMTNRYADEVTIEGRVVPLPQPYGTRYEVHENGRWYLVQVHHPGIRRSCKLENGENALHGGRIICQRQ